MSKQVPNTSYYNPRDNTVHRPQYPVRQSGSGPRGIPLQPPRASQAPQAMATSPGQPSHYAYAGYQPAYQQQPPQQVYSHHHQPVMMQHGTPLAVNGGSMRMPPQYYVQPYAPQAYGQGPPQNMTQAYYAMSSQTQQAHTQSAGIRQPPMPPVGMQSTAYMPQPQQPPPSQLFVPQPAHVPMTMASQLPEKRAKNVIPIIDPNTGHNVLADEAAAGRSASDTARPQHTSSGAIEIKAPAGTTGALSSSLSADAVEYKPMSNGLYTSQDVVGYAEPSFSGETVDYTGSYENDYVPAGQPVIPAYQSGTFEMDDIATEGCADAIQPPVIDASGQPEITFIAEIPTVGDARAPFLECRPTAGSSGEQLPSQPQVSEVAQPIVEEEKDEGRSPVCAELAALPDVSQASRTVEPEHPETEVSEPTRTETMATKECEAAAVACEVPSSEPSCKTSEDHVASPNISVPSATIEIGPCEDSDRADVEPTVLSQPAPSQEPHPATSASAPAAEAPGPASESSSSPASQQSESTPAARPSKPAAEEAPADGPSGSMPSRGSASSNSSTALRSSRSMEAAPSKYSYREDQWSPVNPEGKKLYDREFLLTLQYAKQSVEKPDGLPPLTDIILDKPIGATGPMELNRRPPGKSFPGQDYVDFTPGYVKAASSARGGGGGGGGKGSMSKNDRERSGGNRRVPDSGPQRNVKVIEIKREEVTLHHTDHAWKPLVMKPDETELSKTDELYRKFRSILNKLTPQNFQGLITQVLALPIDTEERLRGIINLVFEKAVEEQSFSVAYANMCKSISSIKVSIAEKPGEVVDFRKLLLTRCQREFEKDLRDEEDSKVKILAIEKAETDETRKRLQDEYNSFISKARRRSLGNIRFIGELFKLRMLTEAIMHDCIVKLLKSNEEDSLECLCRLLTTIGKDIDHEKAKPRNDQYFQQMKKIVSQKKTSSRVRFMLQDIADLRENNWVPRRADNNPKTIEQIHQEAALEAQEKSLMISQVSSRGPAGSSGSRGSSSGGRDKGRDWQSHDKAQHGEDGGWNTVGSSKTMQSAARIDPSKMKLSKQNVGDDIQLGPGGGRPNAWGRGSRPSSSQEMERPSTPVNRFTALAEDPGSRPGRAQGRAEAPRSTRNQGNVQRPPSKLVARTSQEERSSVLAAVKTITREAVSRDSSQEPPRSVERSAPKQSLLSDDEVEKKAQSIHEEYLHNVDPKEALRSIEELQQQDNIDVLVRCMISSVLERSQLARKQTAQLLYEAVKRKLISADNYLKGLAEVTQMADDLAVDIPLIWTYLGQLIAPMLLPEGLPISSLKFICQPLLAVNRAGTLLAKILEDAVHSMGQVKVGEMWTLSGLKWSDFLADGEDVQKFIAEHKLDELDALLGSGEPTSNAHAPVTRKNTTENIGSSLEEILIRKKGSNEEVFDWFEKNLRDEPAKHTQFVRALVECIAKTAIEQKGGTYELNPKHLSGRAPLLLRFIRFTDEEHRIDMELQALFALQSLLHRLQHPANVLRTIFDWLYDEDIISEEAFDQWQRADDPSEREGKGIALESTKQFFTWLQSADSNDA